MTATPLNPEAGPQSAAEALKNIVVRNRRGAAVATYAICSAHPSVLDAAIQQALNDGSMLHVESTSNQVNQFGGYTGTTPHKFAIQIHESASRAGLPADRVLLGADHLGPYCWRSERAEAAMAKGCELARESVLARYQKIHLDASMACADDPTTLPEIVVAERAAMLCQAAESALASLPSGSPRPLYVIGTEVPVPGGEVAEGQAPHPTKAEELQRSLEVFRSAFQARALDAAWERVIAVVVQPGVEFGDSVIFDYDHAKAQHLASGLPKHLELVYEAHSTDYQTPSALAELVRDHFGILKVGPWLTFAFREAIFALECIQHEMPEHRSMPSHVRETLESEMLRNPAHWRPYYSGTPDQLQFARAYSLSDRSRYYWSQPVVQAEVEKLLQSLRGAVPLALLSQYLPREYEAVRAGALENSAQALVRHHIQTVLRTYAAACGVSAKS